MSRTISCDKYWSKYATGKLVCGKYEHSFYFFLQWKKLYILNFLQQIASEIFVFQVSNQQTAESEKSDSYFYLSSFFNLYVYNQLNTAGSETPEQLNRVSVISDQGDTSVVKIERPRHPGEHVQQHKNSRFQLLSTVCTERHQSKKHHNMKTDERNSLIKIPCVMLSVDHFIYKSIR